MRTAWCICDAETELTLQGLQERAGVDVPVVAVNRVALADELHPVTYAAAASLNRKQVS